MNSLFDIILGIVRNSMFYVPRTAAQDKATHGFLTESNNPGGMATEGKFGSTLGSMTNIFAVLKKGWNDTVCAALRALVVAIREDPTSDTLYTDSTFPIGSIFLRDRITSTAQTGADIYLKKGAATIVPFTTQEENAQYNITKTTMTDAATTLTAAQLYGGEAEMTPTAARAVTFPAASALLALMPNAVVGTTIDFAVVNLAAATHAITMTASASITNGGRAGDVTVAAAGTALYRITFTNVTSGSEACEFLRVGTV